MSVTMDPEQQSLADKAADAEWTDEDDDDEWEDVPDKRGRKFLLFAAVPSWMISMLVHVVAFVLLALVTIGAEVEKIANVLSVANASEQEEPVEELELIDEIEPLEVESLTSMPTPLAANETVEMPEEVKDVPTPANDLAAAAIQVDLVEFSEQTAPKNDLLKEIGSVSGTALSGRGEKARKQMVRMNGGTEGSEKAVALALKWFANHQHQNGAWDFEIGPCSCTHRGHVKSCYTGATAMALLPFLGAGQTHMEGEYKETVGRGLAYLIRSMKNNGSLVQGGGNMYSHGLAAITLCEAYAMTNDRKLMMPAQGSIVYIVNTQDPVGGGWRYQPRQPGDTSVVGWQLMALKSGHMAYLQVPPNAVLGTIKFLDTVQADGGAKYGYASPGVKPSTTAIGLLCRMYLGWDKQNPALARGVEYLSNIGPSKTDMYFNYYTTQVMRHYGDSHWEKWNTVMRERLVNSQEKQGHMAGSWNVTGGGHVNDAGGRLYFTSMATMILEVYYRHMPIYGKDAAEEDFPL